MEIEIEGIGAYGELGEVVGGDCLHGRGYDQKTNISAIRILRVICVPQATGLSLSTDLCTACCLSPISQLGSHG